MSILLPAVVAAIIGSWYWRRRGKASIAYIPGPESPSFMLGNFAEFYQYGVGEHEFRWQEEFGPVYRIKSLLGEDRLVIADPKALQHIYQTANTLWLKPTVRREFSRMFLGRGIAWAQGDDHKRHRKVLTPAFGNIESRGMMPIFRKVADRMCQHWKSVITDGHSDSNEIEVSKWLSRATLDAIGEAAFNYEFGSMEDSDNTLARSYSNMFVETFGLPDRRKIFVQHMLIYFPMSFFHLVQRLPAFKRLRAVAEEGDRVARDLINEKTEALQNNRETNRDIMDLLIAANTSENATNKLSEEEILAEMRTIIAAGHETTGSSLCFILYELARHPNVQEKVCTEIRSTFEAVHARGDSDYTMADLEGMHYVLAVLKEVLRIHPVVYGPFVVAARDDVIPLSTPIRTTDGRTITSIPVSAGQYVHSSIAGYNRHADIWGADAHEFRPERWLEDHPQKMNSNFGVYSTLGNFASGAVSCLGWRFAVIEMQTFMVEIVRQFQLSYPENGRRVIRATSGVMAPVLEGEGERGKQLRLVVSPL
ncbi:cytochrome P450 [Amylocystis lapponica]|nr:cytochrome P450 [Amylocystis lapponica]